MPLRLWRSAEEEISATPMWSLVPAGDITAPILGMPLDIGKRSRNAIGHWDGDGEGGDRTAGARFADCAQREHLRSPVFAKEGTQA